MYKYRQEESVPHTEQAQFILLALGPVGTICRPVSIKIGLDLGTDTAVYSS